MALSERHFPAQTIVILRKLGFGEKILRLRYVLNNILITRALFPAQLGSLVAVMRKLSPPGFVVGYNSSRQ